MRFRLISEGKLGTGPVMNSLFKVSKIDFALVFVRQGL
jgi:hypothetical protein